MKWRNTILVTAFFLAIALATHIWGGRLIKFAVANDKTVEWIKTLIELVTTLGWFVLLIFEWLAAKKKKKSTSAPTVSNSQAGHDLNVAGRSIQTGGVNAQGDASVTGGVVSGDKNVSIRGDTISGDKKIVHHGDLIEGDKYVITQPPTSALTSPFQLPPPPADFTGRETELRDLHAAFEKGGVHIYGLQGQGGVGKTALALKLAADLAYNFPDAQIYLDLKGVSDKPLTAAEAISHVLRSFHPEAELPEKEDDLCALFRSVLHPKRALLLMDNAKDAMQVRALIPPAGCTLLVTSRNRFTLPGLEQKSLDTLPSEDATKLLLRIAPRIGGEAEAIAKSCGYLALALRLAATTIAEHIDLVPADYRKKLADEKNRLKLLTLEGNGPDSSVEASITLSYNLLDVETQMLLRMLAVFPDTFDAPAAAGVWEKEKDIAQATLSRLLQYSVLEWNAVTSRYRLHDLTRDFLHARLSAAESGIAARRHATHYSALLHSAHHLHEGGGESMMRALALFDLERENIHTGQAWAQAHSMEDLEAAQLTSNYPDCGTPFLYLRQHPQERIYWREAALASARRLNDRGAENRHLANLGLAYAALANPRRAIEYHEKALVISREIGDRSTECATLGNIGLMYDSMGDYRRAIGYYRQQLTIADEVIV